MFSLSIYRSDQEISEYLEKKGYTTITLVRLIKTYFDQDLKNSEICEKYSLKNINLYTYFAYRGEEELEKLLICLGRSLEWTLSDEARAYNARNRGRYTAGRMSLLIGQDGREKYFWRGSGWERPEEVAMKYTMTEVMKTELTKLLKREGVLGTYEWEFKH